MDTLSKVQNILSSHVLALQGPLAGCCPCFPQDQGDPLALAIFRDFLLQTLQAWLKIMIMINSEEKSICSVFKKNMLGCERTAQTLTPEHDLMGQRETSDINFGGNS